MTIACEAPSAARALLRDACGGIHTRLDTRLSRVDFNDRDAYADMLSRISGPLSAMEGALSAGIAPVLFENWAGHLRAHALRDDIAALGGRFRADRAAPVESEAEAFGVLYVLEGSRLGGQVLARMAEESADAEVRGATRYFRHGARAGHWRSFLGKLEASRGVQAYPERARRAAVSTFQAFEAAFQ